MRACDGRTPVLHVVDSLALGGYERMAVELVNLLDPEEFDASLCATRVGGPMAGHLREGVALTVLGRTGRWDLPGIRRLRRLIRDHGARIVHSHGRGSAELVATCRLADPSFRHVFHDHYRGVGWDDRRPLGLRLACRWRVDAYIGVHRELCDSATRRLGIPASRVHLVRNGVDPGRFTPRGPRRANMVTLVSVAGFRPDKDHRTLLQAVAGCRSRDSLRLVLVGGAAPTHAGYFATCRALVDDLGLASQVTFTGGRDDVPALLADADVGVLSSRSESGPLALLEYMAAGLPYVVTDTGELVAAANGSGAGLVVPVGDVSAFAVALDRLVGMSPDERRDMGGLGRSLVEEAFDQRLVVRRISDVYRALLHDVAPATRASSC